MLNKYFYELFIAWDIIFRYGFYKWKITKTTLRRETLQYSESEQCQWTVHLSVVFDAVKK